MNGLPDITEAMQKMAAAYTDGLAVMTRTLEGLAKQGPDARGLGEQWLRLARMSKDGAITAIEQGFQLWEREVRRMIESSTPTAPPATNPMAAWTEAWTKSVQELTRAGGGGTWAEDARHQTELIQQTFQEGLRAWQRLLQPPERKP
jgi:hypothetical protein